MILQWNARSLIANGQELKGFINKLEIKPDVICIQETWLKQSLDFVIKGYISIRRDRVEGNDGGCAIFVKRGLQFREVKKGGDLEYIVIEIWTNSGSMGIINFYNPCRKLESEYLDEMWENLNEKGIWCGDFNAHSTLWGDRDDSNGNVIEEYLSEKEHA